MTSSIGAAHDQPREQVVFRAGMFGTFRPGAPMPRTRREWLGWAANRILQAHRHSPLQRHSQAGSPRTRRWDVPRQPGRVHARGPRGASHPGGVRRWKRRPGKPDQLVRQLPPPHHHGVRDRPRRVRRRRRCSWRVRRWRVRFTTTPIPAPTSPSSTRGAARPAAAAAENHLPRLTSLQQTMTPNLTHRSPTRGKP
jgi:hypothetical protein